jgi:Rrf2 family protein
MALKLVRADDYAVRAMIHLACLPEGSTALRSEVAEAQRIPGSFMAKILRRLVRARLLDSSRGVKGGFCLAKPASEISMLDILEAIEGPLSMARCVPDARGCEWSSGCPAAAVWSRVQVAVQDILGNADLETLVSARRCNGRVMSAPDIRALAG